MRARNINEFKRGRDVRDSLNLGLSGERLAEYIAAGLLKFGIKAWPQGRCHLRRRRHLGRRVGKLERWTLGGIAEGFYSKYLGIDETNIDMAIDALTKLKEEIK